jgi:glycosyltransferase involved in cell wall biosynthesis
MQLVIKAVPDAGFLLAGEGDLLDSLQELAAELGIADRTFFLGRCRVTEDVLALSEVCVLSSISEGFSNSILEYMAAGRPVVATDVGGAREAVTKETGYLVAPRDFKQMAERVTYLLQNPEQARAMGDRGRAFVANEFSGARQLQRVENLYEKLLN